MILFSMFGIKDNIVVMFNALMMILNTMLIFLIVYYLFNKIGAALISGLLFTFMPHKYVLGENTIESFFLFMLLLFIFFYFIALKKNKITNYSLMFLTLSYCLAVRIDVVVLLPLFAIGLIIFKKENLDWFKFIKKLFLSFLIASPFFFFIVYFHSVESVRGAYLNTDILVIVPIVILLLYIFKLHSGSWKQFIKKNKFIILTAVLLTICFWVYTKLINDYYIYESFILSNLIKKTPVFISVTYQYFLQFAKWSWLIISIIGIIGLFYKNNHKVKSYFFFLLSFFMFYFYTLFDPHPGGDTRFLVIIFPWVFIILSFGMINLWNRLKSIKYFKIFAVIIVIIILSQFNYDDILKPQRSFLGIFDNRIHEDIKSFMLTTDRLEKENYILMPGLQSSMNLLYYTDNNFIDVDPNSRDSSSMFLFNKELNITEIINQLLKKNETIYYVRSPRCVHEFEDCAAVDKKFEFRFLFDEGEFEVYQIMKYKHI